jgi:lipid A 3-O-deacylase
MTMVAGKIITNLFLCILPLSAWAQAIDNVLSYKNIDQDNFLRINYENDFFSGTDKYYTQGVEIDLVSPWVKDFPFSKILVHPKYSYIRYGLGVESDVYTPVSVTASNILYGDRPFASCLFLKTFLTATDSVHGNRFSTALNTGVIGPAGLGMEMQTGIHKALGDVTPHGWPNQIHNDAILNYQVDFEHKLVQAGRYFLLDADGMARAGTLSDKAALGITVMVGYFDDPYKSTIATGKNFRIYAYDHPEVDVVAYDATLEGGVFDHTSPYTLSRKDIEPVVLQNRAGVVVVYRKLYLEYFQSVIGSEFRYEDFHVWGGIQIAFAL